MRDSGSNAAERVIQRVSDATGRTVRELPPLYTVVDPDALERVVESTSDACVAFRYAGHEVTVNSEGEVGLSGTSTSADGPPSGRNGTGNGT